MKKLNKYIAELLGTELKVKALNTAHLKKLPIYIREMYKIKTALLFDRKILLLAQKTTENLTANQYRKQITLLENAFNLPAVLILEQLEAYNRKRLIEKQIAFIIPGKQMYIPHLFLDLREFRGNVQKKTEKIQPAAQCILLYHLLKENVENMNFKTIADKINYTQMTITRGAKDLEEKQLCRIEGTNEKRILFLEDKKTLWQKAQPYLQNPVKRKIYIEEYIDDNLIFKSGYTALSHLTDIAGEPLECFAISKTDYMYLRKQKKLNITNKTEGRICLEIWKYAPNILAENHIVDPLSLYLTFKETEDERVEMEIEKMVNRLW